MQMGDVNRGGKKGEEARLRLNIHYTAMKIIFSQRG